MKILSAEQIRAADQYTIAHEPIRAIDLMERASHQCADWLLSHVQKGRFYIFCGRGNNGGDGLAVARMLNVAGRDVAVFLLSGSTSCSQDNQINQRRLIDSGVEIHLLNSTENLPALSSDDTVVEALFGTGLTRPLSGLAREIVAELNAVAARRIAIDLPGGLLTEEEHDPENIAFHADQTLSFQVPKLCFFLPSCSTVLGEWFLLDIGLDPRFMDEQKSSFSYLTSTEVAGLLHKREAFSHKGTFGHALIIAGSYGKIGAAVLATRAALRSGCGLVTSLVPKCGHEILQSSAPEAMTLAEDELYLGHFPDVSRFSSLGIGPGLGQEEETRTALLDFLQKTDKPLVLDADALNLLSIEDHWPNLLPKKCILTPHPGEFDRLFGKHDSTLARIQTQIQFAKAHNCCLILKGRYTSIALPGGQIYFNSSGNPGMATGGSGDVLSGILTGLLAQSYSIEEAALLGVHLHGLAGDLAKNEIGEEALLASDIIEHLGAVFQAIHQLSEK